MLFPLSDDDRHLTKPAVVTITLLVANVLVYIYQFMYPDSIWSWSLIPLELTTGQDLVGDVQTANGIMPHMQGPSPIQLTLLSSMFMHGGLMHLGGNMLYLWIFGDNVEHRFGAKWFLIFYLVSGLAATAAQVMIAPESMIPNVGASGAISGVLGAYLVLFPRNKVNAIFVIRMVTIPAFVVLGLWIVMQVFSGYQGMASVGESGGVAYGAHVGGFVAGVIVGLIARMMMKTEPDSVLLRQYQRDPKVKRLW